MPTRIPLDHPRRQSLLTREHMKQALEGGLIHTTGLIAYGRGEAFDYLLGEKSPAIARRAAAAAAAALLNARQPVLSCNGNVVALAARQCVRVSKATGARLEVNLFHRTEARVRRLVTELKRAGGKDVLGPSPDARIPGLSSDRALCHRAGLFGADVALVPVEDGDRAQALQRMRKTVITIDLNPLSRTARSAAITIVDELTRALPLIEEAAQRLRTWTPRRRQRVVDAWDNQRALLSAQAVMSRTLRGA